MKSTNVECKVLSVEKVEIPVYQRGMDILTYDSSPRLKLTYVLPHEKKPLILYYLRLGGKWTVDGYHSDIPRSISRKDWYLLASSLLTHKQVRLHTVVH